MRDRSTGPWDEVVMQNAQGAVLRLTIRTSRRGLWRWEWEERYLGYTTRLVSLTACRYRDECIRSLQAGLASLGMDELADAIQRWEEDDGGS